MDFFVNLDNAVDYGPQMSVHLFCNYWALNNVIMGHTNPIKG